MKILMLLFVLVMSCVGQNSFKLDSLWTYPGEEKRGSLYISDGDLLAFSKKVYFFDCDTLIGFPMKQQMRILLGEFERDCWNDSTYVKNFSLIFIQDSIGRYRNINSGGRYKHKPPTFKNFLLWIKKGKSK